MPTRKLSPEFESREVCGVRATIEDGRIRIDSLLGKDFSIDEMEKIVEMLDDVVFEAWLDKLAGELRPRI